MCSECGHITSDMQVEKIKTHTRYYKVAGITIQVNSDLPITDNTFHPKFRLFEVNGPGGDNVVIHHHFYIPEEFSKLDHNKRYYQKINWTVFQLENSWLFKRCPALDNRIDSISYLEIDDKNSKYSVYCSNIYDTDYAKGNFPSLTLFKGDQILLTWLLAKRKGCFFHANGFAINNNGFLITGLSGAGKSTLSAMLKKNNIQIICDDRMLLRRIDKNFTINGTWIHGTVPDFSNISTPLKGIFFIQKSKTNQIIQIKTSNEIVQGLLQSLIRPFLPKEKWPEIFSVLGSIARNIPCYNLLFDKSGKIIKHIKRYGNEFND